MRGMRPPRRQGRLRERARAGFAPERGFRPSSATPAGETRAGPLVQGQPFAEGRLSAFWPAQRSCCSTRRSCPWISVATTSFARRSLKTTSITPLAGVRTKTSSRGLHRGWATPSSASVMGADTRSRIRGPTAAKSLMLGSIPSAVARPLGLKWSGCRCRPQCGTAGRGRRRPLGRVRARRRRDRAAPVGSMLQGRGRAHGFAGVRCERSAFRPCRIEARGAHQWLTRGPSHAAVVTLSHQTPPDDAAARPIGDCGSPMSGRC